jgi:hypothetical protein
MKNPAIVLFLIIGLAGCRFSKKWEGKPPPNTASEPAPAPANQPPGKGDSVGVFNPANSTFLLRNNNSPGFADIEVAFGQPGDIPVVGDWNGNRTTTVGVFRPSTGTFLLKNSNVAGNPDLIIPFGKSGDIPLAGDWNGDGTQTIGVFRPAEARFYLRNQNTPGKPDLVVKFGEPGDLPVVGDWDGDGKQTVGVFRRSDRTFYIRNSNTSGPPEQSFKFDLGGNANEDRPLAGDWEGDGVVSFGLWRDGVFYLRKNRDSKATTSVAYGIASHQPLVGNWDGQ